MHDEVFEATQDSGVLSKDSSISTASSPSEAYANLTLESRETSGVMAADSESVARTTANSEQPPPRPPPRSSSPAKRLHSAMDDNVKEHMDVETQSSGARRSSDQSSSRATKHLPAAARATSVEMLDAPANGSATSSDSTSVSNPETAASSISTHSSPQRSSSNIPSLDEQVSQVLAIHGKPTVDGQEGYVISEQWLARVFARTSENRNKPEQFHKEAVEGEIGPIDNSDIVDTDDLSDQNGEDFVPLRPGLTIGQDFEVLPTEAWELILGWYGLKDGSPVIRRYAHNTSLSEYSENILYEVHPPIFTIRKVSRSTGTPPLQAAAKHSPKLVASRSDGYVEFLRAAKKAAGIDLKTRVQVWRILKTAPTDQDSPQPSGMLTPESSPRNGFPVASVSPGNPCPLVMDSASFTNLAVGTEREMVTGKDETANEKYNGHMTLHLAGLAEDQVLVLEEQDEKGGYVSEATSKIAIKNGAQSGGNKIGTKPNKAPQNNNSGRASPALSGPMTRGRTRTGRTRGTVGLTNLGNTCYMNSALQCIRSVEELYYYFADGPWKSELNPDNPLGHGGTIAKTYAGLLSSIYSEDNLSAFAPRNFKVALGKAQPLFSGYGQQDSQEFLSFLVDGLHEDLNRVHKKPYTENPESDDNTVHDPEAIKALGEKFRQIHHSRNDSVAMDLFNGFYKNTMVCPDCDKVSITFDPYSLLTLQLPIEQTWQHTIYFIPLYGKPIKVEVDVDKNGTIKSLKEFIAKRFDGVKWDRLMGAEVYTHKFYRVLENNKTIAECNIGQRDEIFFFELSDVPTNWPPRKKPHKQRSMLSFGASSEEDIPSSSSPLADKMLVPIFHRSQSMSSYRGPSWSLVQWPSYIVLTREEAKDYDTISRKVLAKVAQMTTRPFLTEFSGPSLNQSRNGSDLVLTTEEDASSNGDPRVHDGSVEGEDNMVEVTMANPTGVSPTGSVKEDELPEVLKPGSFIAPELRTLFDMKYIRRGKEMVPTGWSSIDSNKSYESITQRIRVAPSRQSSEQSFEGNSNASSSEDVDDTPQFSVEAHSSIDAADQSSDEDVPTVEAVPTFSRGGRQKPNSKRNKRKNAKWQKNMARGPGKKGRDRFLDQPSQSFSDLESDDDEGLIRLGEAVVLDWTAEGQDALFGGIDSDDERGAESIRFIDTLSDPELQAKKVRRAARRKSGITLEECFAETSKSEVLSEDNAWYCNRCKELRRATKTLEIWTVPDILVVHLKRFSAHRTFRDKIEALVDFPVEGLDLSGKVGLPEGKELLYDLFAVDNHYGGLGGGHYTAYAQNFFDKKWYDYNDSSVSSKVNPQSVVTSSAYLLFYRRRSDRPLGPRSLQDIVEKVYNPAFENEEEDVDDAKEPTNRDLSRSPAGNGSRLGDSSRNGSSSAFGAGAGVLRGGGLTSAGNLHLKEAAAETAVDDEMLMDTVDQPPAYMEDEGFAEEDDFEGVNMNTMNNTFKEPLWSFSNINKTHITDDEEIDDDTASNAPLLGSEGGGSLQHRMLEDFGDDIGGLAPGFSTPNQFEDEVAPVLGGESGDPGVQDVVLDDEEVPVGVSHVERVT